jgi:molecular chaperone GrpE (heat shock protein)
MIAEGSGELKDGKTDESALPALAEGATASEAAVDEAVVSAGNTAESCPKNDEIQDEAPTNPPPDSESPVTTPASAGPAEDPVEACKRMMDDISRQILMITENQDRNEAELKNLNAMFIDADYKKLNKGYFDILRLYDKAQEELDQLRKGLYRQLLEPLLITLARIYVDYLGNLERIKDPKQESAEISEEDVQKHFKRLKNNFSNMFDDFLQLLEENDVEKYESKIGDRYSPKFCKVTVKIETADKEQHGAVAKSLSPGFYIGNRVLLPEQVEVYVFKGE